MSQADEPDEHSISLVPNGVDPEETGIKGVEWLERNAGPVDVDSIRGTDSTAWERGSDDPGKAAVESAQESDDAAYRAVRLPDGDPHATLLVEAAGSDNGSGPFAGACDCDGWRYHDGPCAHLVCRAVRSVLHSGEVPVDVERYEELKTANGPVDVDDTPDAGVSDVGGIETAADGAGDEGTDEDGEDIVDVDAAGQSVRGPEAGDQHPPDEIVDGSSEIGGPQLRSESSVDADSAAMPNTAGDPFATQLAENIPERFVMGLGDEPYIRRAGYAAIARDANLRVTVDPVTPAEETDFEHARYKAVVRDADGEVVGEDFGTAHLDGEDLSGAKYQLDELAATRACRRALEWATGAGATLQRGGSRE